MDSKAWQTLKDRLGIVNPHGVIEYAKARGIGPGVFLDYRAQDLGRGGNSAAWQVFRPGYRTDPTTSIHDQYRKTFKTFSYDHSRKATCDAAKAWAGSRYGITEWGTVPGLPGTVFPKAVADLIKADLKAAAK